MQAITWVVGWLCTAAPVVESAVEPAPVKVAVLELKASGIDEVVAKNLGELFTAEAGKVPGYSVIGHAEIQDMVGFEIQKQTLGCTDASCFAELGGALGVDLIISGSIGQVGETFVANVRLIDIKRSETKNRVGESISGRVEILPDYVRLLPWRLFGKPIPADVQAAFEATKARLEAPQVITAKAADAPVIASVRPVTPTEPAGPTWPRTLKRISTGIAVGSVLVGGGLHGWSVMRATKVKGEELDDGTTLYRDTTQVSAQRTHDIRRYATYAYITGGVAAGLAIVFAIMQPALATGSVQVEPTAQGALLRF